MASSAFQGFPSDSKTVTLDTKSEATAEVKTGTLPEKFSHFQKLSMYAARTPLGENKNCLFTARAIVHLLTGRPITLQADKKHALTQVKNDESKLSLTRSTLQMVDSPVKRMEGNFRDLFSPGTSFEGVSDLLTKKPEHCIYHIILGQTIHAFVIEKISDENIAAFRVYHSWISRFNLNQGLKENPAMSEEALKAFIASIQAPCEGSFKYWSRRTPEDVSDTATVIKYPFEPATLDFLLQLKQTELENFKLEESELEKITNKTLRGLLKP